MSSRSCSGVARTGAFARWDSEPPSVGHRLPLVLRSCDWAKALAEAARCYDHGRFGWKEGLVSHRAWRLSSWVRVNDALNFGAFVESRLMAFGMDHSCPCKAGFRAAKHQGSV